MASALGRWICSLASEWATTAMSAATPHSIALSARGAAWAPDISNPPAKSAATTDLTFVSEKERAPGFPGAVQGLPYLGLPCPLVDGLVAVSLEGAVLLLAEPGPAVAPVVPEPLGLTTLPDGAAVVPPAAAPPER